MRRWLLTAVVLVQLAACGTTGPAPVDSFYRLPDTAVPGVDRSLAGEVRVAAFEASDLYQDRAIIYSDDVVYEFKRHHYHFWIDSPPAMLQSYLAQYLLDSHAATSVTMQAGRTVDVEVSGRINAFERHVHGATATIRVALQLRIAHGDRAGATFVSDYVEEISVASAGMAESVAAFGEAINRIFARFVADALQAA